MSEQKHFFILEISYYKQPVLSPLTNSNISERLRGSHFCSFTLRSLPFSVSVIRLQVTSGNLTLTSTYLKCQVKCKIHAVADLQSIFSTVKFISELNALLSSDFRNRKSFIKLKKTFAR